MKKNSVLVIFLTIYFTFFATSAQATVVTPIDLNDFFADPAVTVALDGMSATMAEDPALASVILSNDPGLGDPVVIIPSLGALLKFEYTFSEGAGNDDEFFVSILDDFGLPTLDPGFDFLAIDSMAGMVSFDLSPLVGQTVGLLFELASFDQFFDSTVEISNLRIETPDPVVDVPLPPVTGLMFLGLIWLNVRRKNCMVNKNII